MRRISYPVLAITVVGALTLGVMVICGMGYVTATKSGADYEQSLAATRQKAIALDESVHQAIVAATGVPTITASDTRYALVLAMRRPGADIEEMVMQALQGASPELPNYPPNAGQEVVRALRRHIPIALALRNLEKKQIDHYVEKLESDWEGTWLRVAGYPKSPLNAPSAASPQLAVARE